MLAIQLRCQWGGMPIQPHPAAQPHAVMQHMTCGPRARVDATEPLVRADITCNIRPAASQVPQSPGRRPTRHLMDADVGLYDTGTIGRARPDARECGAGSVHTTAADAVWRQPPVYTHQGCNGDAAARLDGAARLAQRGAAGRGAGGRGGYFSRSRYGVCVCSDGPW